MSDQHAPPTLLQRHDYAYRCALELYKALSGLDGEYPDGHNWVFVARNLVYTLGEQITEHAPQILADKDNNE